MRAELKKASLTKTAEDYASRTSIHGIGYIFDRELGVVERLLWMALVLVFLGLAVLLNLNIWIQWREQQVMSTIKNIVQKLSVTNSYGCLFFGVKSFVWKMSGVSVLCSECSECFSMI